MTHEPTDGPAAAKALVNVRARIATSTERLTDALGPFLRAAEAANGCRCGAMPTKTIDGATR
jgi:hypothetical protein